MVEIKLFVETKGRVDCDDDHGRHGEDYLNFRGPSLDAAAAPHRPIASSLSCHSIRQSEACEVKGGEDSANAKITEIRPPTYCSHERHLGEVRVKRMRYRPSL